MLRPLALLLIGPFLAGAVAFVWSARQPSWSVYSIDGWCGTPHRTTFREYVRWRRDASARGLTPRAHTEDDNLVATSFLFVQSAGLAAGAAAAGLLVETRYRARSRPAALSPRPA